MDNFSEEELADYREIFDSLLDSQDDGVLTLTTKDLADFFRAHGQNPSNGKLTAYINEVDVDGTGTLDFNEWLSFVCLEDF